MLWWQRYFLRMEKAGDGNGGGGGSGSGGDGKGGDGKSGSSNSSSDVSKELAEMKSANAKLLERLDKLEGKGSQGGEGGGGKPDDKDLQQKAREQREADEKKSGDTKALEAALRFGMQSENFLKQNASLLPKDIAEIFKAAEKENYSNAIEKDAALKAAIVQSFFAVQANHDLLTDGLKSQLEDYLKLTKNGKQEKAQHVYSSIFEPALEMMRRTKKAEALSKGHGSASEVDQGYKNRLMANAQKHFLGVKPNAT